MHKLKFFVDLEKEEQWLNDMARQGYVLSRKSFGYIFEPAVPGQDAVIRIDYRTFRRYSDFEDYRALFEDCGWMHIAGTRSSGAQYFRKLGTATTEDDIFSDMDSKAGRYKRLADMWASLAACFIPLFVVLLTSKSINLEAFLNPKSLYYTPGLWEKEGAAFWGSFLFETPFALGRGYLWLTIPIMIALAAIFSYKAKKQYETHRHV